MNKNTIFIYAMRSNEPLCFRNMQTDDIMKNKKNGVLIIHGHERLFISVKLILEATFLD